MWVNVAPPLAVSAHLRHTALVLLIVGGFFLFGCLSTLMRTGMAKGSGEPIPDEPSADVLTKIGRGIARGERNRVPLYRGLWVLFLVVGLVLLALAGWAILAAYLGPGPGLALAILALVVMLWVGTMVGTRLGQKAKVVDTPTGDRYRVTMTPRGVAVIDLFDRGKSWVHTPVELYQHFRKYHSTWTVSAKPIELPASQTAATSEDLSSRVQAVHRYRALLAELTPGHRSFWEA